MLLIVATSPERAKAQEFISLTVRVLFFVIFPFLAVPDDKVDNDDARDDDAVLVFSSEAT